MSHRDYRSPIGYRPNRTHSRSYEPRPPPDRKHALELLQLSGPGRHFSALPKQLAEGCFLCKELSDEHGQLHFILGIKSNGASELLIPAAARLPTLQRNWERGDPKGIFSSFSPIVITGIASLEKFLDSRMPRKTKKGRPIPSRANKGYELANPVTESSRCNYERTRTLVRRLTNRLYHDPLLYGFSAGSSRDIVSEFILLTHNAYSMGTETGFLDAAWGVVDADALRRAGSDLYMMRPRVEQDIDFQNSVFAGDKTRRACAQAESLLADDYDDPRIMLKKYLHSSLERSQPDRQPCIILFDWERTKNLLGHIGVETNSWTTELHSMFCLGSKKSKSDGNIQADPKKSRSRSPGSRYNGPIISNRPREYKVEAAKMHVIDVKALSTSVRRTARSKDGLVDACRDFDVPEIDDLEPNGWKEYCAGNELAYLWSLFVKIADGPSIDETYAALFKDKGMVGDDDDEDEEEDDEDSGGIAGLFVPKKYVNPYEIEEDGLLSD